MSEWIKCDDAMPVTGCKVLAAFRNSHGKWRRVCAIHLTKFAWDCDAYDWDEHSDADIDEKTGTWYWPAGWYEAIESHSDYQYWSVTDGQVTHWMPLPAPPSK